MLDQLFAAARRRAGALIEREDAIRAHARDAPSPLELAAALTRPGLQVLGEVKRRSPSAGDLALGLDAAAQALRYVAGGVAGISVLTEPDHFGGSLADLRAVRAAVDVPLLRKDFIIHPVQVAEARAAGADAVLLIVAALMPDELVHLLSVVDELGMQALVEVHTVDEARIALDSGALIVGVNNRDLRTFATDLSVAETVAPHLASVVRVAESGVAGPVGAGRMAAAGFDAVLVGEALVRSADPGALVGQLRSVAT